RGEDRMSDQLDELLAKKQELETRLEKIKQDIASGLSSDFEEQATELENRDVLLEIARVTEEELEAIKAVLNDVQ
ncbi:MAG: TraR/DksA family transcriptional regulator, partial [Gammaproteobacteria bacterium]